MASGTCLCDRCRNRPTDSTAARCQRPPAPARNGTPVKGQWRSGFCTPHRQRSSTSAPAEENLSLQTYTPPHLIGPYRHISLLESPIHRGKLSATSNQDSFSG